MLCMQHSPVRRLRCGGGHPQPQAHLLKLVREGRVSEFGGNWRVTRA